MSVQITIRFPNGKVQTYTFEKQKIFIGRRDGNDIKLPFPYVSGRHCMVQGGQDTLYIQDLGSTNGTLLNGSQLSPHEFVPLQKSDIVQIGPLEVMIENIQEATIIEKVPEDLTQSNAPEVLEHPRIQENEVSTMWELQTGFTGAFQRKTSGIEVDDRKVDVIRGIDSIMRPHRSSEQRILGQNVEPPVKPLQVKRIPSGLVYQIGGFAIIILSIVFILLIIFA